MALSKKMLLAMDISDEKADQIIEAHRESINGLTTVRDQYKEDAEKLPEVQKALDDARKELEKLSANASKIDELQKKYSDLKAEYDSFKADTESKATHAVKVNAYRKLLKEAGVSENRLDTVLKVSDVDSVELDKDGNIKNSDKLTESVKKEWADFIPTTREKGAEVSNPPANNGGEVKKVSRAAEMVAQYRNEHYGNPIKED